MCEAHVYIIKDGKEEKVMEDVDLVEVFQDGLRLVNIFGEQKVLKAKLKRYDSSQRKIIIETP